MGAIQKNWTSGRSTLRSGSLTGFSRKQVGVGDAGDSDREIGAEGEEGEPPAARQIGGIDQRLAHPVRIAPLLAKGFPR
jgi:hypothetical protein